MENASQPKSIRPRINTKNINIRTNPNLLKLINSAAKKSHIKTSKWIRRCLIIELQKLGYDIADEKISIKKKTKKEAKANVKPPVIDDSLEFLE